MMHFGDEVWAVSKFNSSYFYSEEEVTNLLTYVGLCKQQVTVYNHICQTNILYAVNTFKVF